MKAFDAGWFDHGSPIFYKNVNPSLETSGEWPKWPATSGWNEDGVEVGFSVGKMR